VQTDGFIDARRFSIGVEGKPGTRQAMPIANMAWHRNGFFWDGRAPLLRDQALRPIQDPLEMNETLANVEAILRTSTSYLDQFTRAFGNDMVTSERIALALEQFMLTLISTRAKFDSVMQATATYTAAEQRGRDLFFKEFDPISASTGGECFHCHGGPNFTNDRYMNNGLDTDAEFTDGGRFLVTNNPRDRAKFKTPSLRNVALTAPYMHDGRFTTLEEAVQHYNTSVKQSSTAKFILQYNLQLGGLRLTDQDVQDIVAFLHTLTDEAFIRDQEFARP
jgi:cytochrome c peroxidase